MQAAGAAQAHQDHDGAVALLDESRRLFDGARWLPEQQVPVLGRLGALRHRVGDSAAARRDVDAAWALFTAERERIIDIYRAGVLRPVAEAFAALGDRDAALMVYKRAVEEGVHNPNSRPRADDLAATCCSLALHAFEPDTVLRARLQQVCDGLGAPW
jgi:hypothetical protein